MTIKRLVGAAALSVGLLTLAGCQTPLIHAAEFALNWGSDLPERMMRRNLTAVVIYDEEWAGSAPFVAQNNFYTVGIKRGTPEYGLRAVLLAIRHPEYGAWLHLGEKTFWIAAIVPDHMQALKKYDLVEFRMAKRYGAVEDFTRDQEGNIVLKVMCEFKDPQYEACLNGPTLPRIGRYQAFGETGTLYPVSNAEYGFTFTPKYDTKGTLLW
jgi:hypothetical protein